MKIHLVGHIKVNLFLYPRFFWFSKTVVVEVFTTAASLLQAVLSLLTTTSLAAVHLHPPSQASEQELHGWKSDGSRNVISYLFLTSLNGGSYFWCFWAWNHQTMVCYTSSSNIQVIISCWSITSSRAADENLDWCTQGLTLAILSHQPLCLVVFQSYYPLSIFTSHNFVVGKWCLIWLKLTMTC